MLLSDLLFVLSVQIAARSALLSGVAVVQPQGLARHSSSQVFMSQETPTAVAKHEEQVKILPLWLPWGDCLGFAPIHHPYYHLESI